jgi:hypothetical protein
MQLRENEINVQKRRKKIRHPMVETGRKLGIEIGPRNGDRKETIERKTGYFSM